VQASLFFFGHGVQFHDPIYLDVAVLAAAVLCLGIAVQIVLVRRRPARTRGSSYPLLGGSSLWFVTTILLGVAAVAAARPLLVSRDAAFTRGSVDVALLVDVSASMWARDLGVSRLEIAAREALGLRDMLRPGDRAALFVFGGSAIRKVHLSANLDRLAEIVVNLRPPDVVAADAFPWESDVVNALEHLSAALDTQDRFESRQPHWQPEPRANRFVVLFTDGDFSLDAEHAQRLEDALALFRRRGVSIYAVGIGTKAGAGLADVLSQYRRGDGVDTSLLQEIADLKTSLNPAAVELFSRRTGGNAALIEQPLGGAQDLLRQAVNSHRAVSLQTGADEQKQEIWGRVLSAGLLLLAAAILFY
jgi:hypothetical protein